MEGLLEEKRNIEKEISEKLKDLCVKYNVEVLDLSFNYDYIQKVGTDHKELTNIDTKISLKID